MIKLLLQLVGVRTWRNELPSSRVFPDSSFGNVDAGTIYRILRPRRWWARA